uniref:porin n=1 Tax=Ningiella ruwaisensis TaxID=2364274 RepID=UPI0010A06FFC|nr:porin [Ningiella ruwaisensis]
MFISLINSTRLSLFILIVCSATVVSASDDLEFKFSGFANIGVTYAEGETYGFRTQLLNAGRDGFSLAPDTLLGLQLNTSLSTNFDAVVQFVIQDRSNNNFSNYLELAFLRYQLSRNVDIRAGRFSTNSYLYTDFRYVSQATYWVRPPLEMYSTVGSLGNMDGAQLSYTYPLDFGAAKISAAYGLSELNNDSDDGPFRAKYEDLYVLNLELQSNDWRIQGAYINARLNDIRFAGSDEVRLAPFTAPEIVRPVFVQVARAIIPEGERVSYYSISGKYYLDELEFTAEYGDYDSDWALSSASQFGYISAAYNLGMFTPFVTLAAHNRDSDPEIVNTQSLIASLPRDLGAFVALSIEPANEASKDASIDQRSLSVGFRWDFNADWAFKAQIDHFKIGENGSGLFSIEKGLGAPDEKTSFNVASFGITTTF